MEFPVFADSSDIEEYHYQADLGLTLRTDKFSTHGFDAMNHPVIGVRTSQIWQKIICDHILPHN